MCYVKDKNDDGDNDTHAQYDTVVVVFDSAYLRKPPRELLLLLLLSWKTDDDDLGCANASTYSIATALAAWPCLLTSRLAT